MPEDDRLGPFPPHERPFIWVLHEGVWEQGYLLAWLKPSPQHPYWRAAARWKVGTLQYETWVPAKWTAKRRDEDGGLIPAPPVPEGETGFLPPAGM